MAPQYWGKRANLQKRKIFARIFPCTSGLFTKVEKVFYDL
jgi:hypothetical protein